MFKAGSCARYVCHTPARRHVAVEVVAAVSPVVPGGIRIFGRRKGAEIRAAQGDLSARINEPGGDVVEIRVVRGPDAAQAHKAGDKIKNKGAEERAEVADGGETWASGNSFAEELEVGVFLQYSPRRNGWETHLGCLVVHSSRRTLPGRLEVYLSIARRGETGKTGRKLGLLSTVRPSCPYLTHVSSSTETSWQYVQDQVSSSGVQ